jgi:uncharacterized membrane protein
MKRVRAFAPPRRGIGPRFAALDRMQGRMKLLGHSVHPMLVVFPLGLLGVVPLFDVLAFVTKNAVFGPVAFWVLSIGLLGGFAAAVVGFVDWLSVPSGTRAYRVGLIHMFVNIVSMGFYILSWWARLFAHLPDRHWAPFVLALVGLATAVVGGWLGGELVEQHGIGVRDEAGLNAPSSLDAERFEERRGPRRPREPQPIV